MSRAEPSPDLAEGGRAFDEPGVNHGDAIRCCLPEWGRRLWGGT